MKTEKPVEVETAFGTVKIARDTDEKTFNVEIPKYTFIKIVHTENNIDVMAESGMGSIGKSIPVKSKLVKLKITL